MKTNPKQDNTVTRLWAESTSSRGPWGIVGPSQRVYLNVVRSATRQASGGGATLRVEPGEPSQERGEDVVRPSLRDSPVVSSLRAGGSVAACEHRVTESYLEVWQNLV